MFKVIDTHTHLDAEEFNEDRAEAFARAREAGVGKVFLPAIDVKTTHAVLALSREYPGYAYPMIGLHPEEVKADWKEQLSVTKEALIRAIAPLIEEDTHVVGVEEGQQTSLQNARPAQPQRFQPDMPEMGDDGIVLGGAFAGERRAKMGDQQTPSK